MAALVVSGFKCSEKTRQQAPHREGGGNNNGGDVAGMRVVGTRPPSAGVSQRVASGGGGPASSTVGCATDDGKPLSVGVQSVIELRSRRVSSAGQRAQPSQRQKSLSTSPAGHAGSRQPQPQGASPKPPVELRDPPAAAASASTSPARHGAPAAAIAGLEVGGCQISSAPPRRSSGSWRGSPPRRRTSAPGLAATAGKARPSQESEPAPRVGRSASINSVSRRRSQTCSTEEGTARGDADPAAAAEAAKARIRNFERKKRQEEERRINVMKTDSRNLQEERRREEEAINQRRAEIYALNTLLAHVESQKQQMFAAGVLDSLNNGV